MSNIYVSDDGEVTRVSAICLLYPNRFRFMNLFIKFFLSCRFHFLRRKNLFLLMLRWKNEGFPAFSLEKNEKNLMRLN